MSAAKQHYGLNKISRSLRHFLIGKGFKVFTSLTILLLLARYLPKAEYAAYVSFQAVILLVGLVTTIGIQPVLFRYLPELRAGGNNKMMYGMLLVGMIFRAILVAVGIYVVQLFLPTIAEMFKFSQWVWLAPWFLMIGVFHLTSLTLAQALESLLWQKEAQYSLAFASVLKLVFISIAVWIDVISLPILVGIEGIAEGLLLLVLVWRGISRWRTDAERAEGSFSWWRENRNRVIRFGLWGFLVGQSKVLYGNGPNRLVAAHYLPTADIAMLGVADSAARMVRRAMPTRLLLGMVRPIFMARFSTTGDFENLTRMANLVYRFNLIVLALPIVILFVVGEPLFDTLTAGNYSYAGPLLGGFMILLLTEGLRSLLELLVQAVEKFYIFLVGNIVQSLSLGIAFLLIGKFGIWALLIANIVGTVLSNIIAIVWLRQYNYRFTLDYALIAIIILAAVFAAITGSVVYSQTNSVMYAIGTMIVCYLLPLVIKMPLLQEEKEKVFKLIRKALGKSGRATAT